MATKTETAPGFAVDAIRCECGSVEIDFLHKALEESDELVAKALRVSEIAQIARAEMRMRDLLLQKWRNRAKQAARSAGRIVTEGGSVSAALRSVDSIMSYWDDDVAKPYGRELERIYRLARTAGFQKASGATKQSLQYSTPNFTEVLGDDARVTKAKVTPTFDLLDESAIAALQDDQMLWIGNHYDRNVRDTIRRSATDKLTRGLGRAEAGRAIGGEVARSLDKVTVPAGFNGSQAKYFEGLAANAATVARTRGQLRSFIDLGVTRYEIVNPNDSRTSRQCQILNGRVFTVEHGRRQVETEAGATVPDDIRSAHPWLGADKIDKIISGAGKGKGEAEAALAEAGLSLPPYHFRCRSTIDVSSDAGSFEALSETETRALGTAPKPRPIPKKAPKPKPTTKPKPIKAAERAATMPSGGFRFERLPKVQTTEMRERINGSIAKVIESGGVGGTSSGWNKATAGFRADLRLAMGRLYGTKAVTTKSGQAYKVITRGPMASAGWDGVVNVRQGLIPTTGKSVRAGAMKTLIHEEFHHASVYASSAYRGGGAFIEEATVELSARRAMRDLGLPQQTGWQVKWSEVGGFRTGSSYFKEIEELHRVVKLNLGWTAEETIENVQTAAVLMRANRLPLKKATTPEQHVDNFLEALNATKPIPANQRDKLKKVLVSKRVSK